MLESWRTEVAFGTAPNAATPAYQDVAGYVVAPSGISVTHGRTDQFEAISPSQASNTFANKDGRFTAENTSSPYYPNVLLATRIRHSFRFTTAGNPTVAGNFLSANAASMETSVADWAAGGSVHPTLTQDATHAQDGTKALLVTWGTGGSLPQAATVVSGLTIGRTYTASAYFYVPSGGSPTALLQVAGQFSSATSVTNAFQRRNVTWTATANSHSLQVWPGSAPTSGDRVWVDAVQVDEGTVVGTFTTSAPPIFYRFDGCVDAWPMQWSPGAFYAEAPVSATDRLKRLGLSRALPDIIGCENLTDSPTAYYNLGEPEGSASAGNSSPTPLPSLVVTSNGVGGTAVFGNATGPGTDGLTALQLTRSSATVGQYLTADMPLQLGSAFAITIECWFNTAALQSMEMCSVDSVTGSFFAIAIDSGGFVHMSLLNLFTGFVLTGAGDGPSCADGLNHHAVFTVQVSGGIATLLLYLDGTVTTNPKTTATTFILAGTTLRIGGHGDASFSPMFNGVISQVAVYPTALSATRVTQHYLAGSTGFAGERSDQRIARIAGYAGIGSADITAAENGSSLLQAQDTSGQKALDLIQAASDTENGVSFFNGFGDLVSQGRSHRYNKASSLTLAAGQYTIDLQPVLDDFGVQNDVTATRQNGATVRVVNTTSTGLIGTYTGQIDSLATTDAETQDAANWRVNTAGVPTVRFPTVTVEIDKISTATALQVLALEIGDRITLSGIPTSGPATSVDLFIEGWSENYTTDSYTVSFNCSRYSAASNGHVWIFDNAASVFDTMLFGY